MGNKSKVYIGLAVSLLAFFTLQNQFKAYGATSAVDEVTITVPASCSLSNTVSSTHSATIETGIYQDDIGETTINAVCNDSEGFSVYAVGYTDGEYGNNTMKPGVTSATNAIATGTATSGDTSNWAMKLSSLSENFSLENSFGSYHLVPSDYIKVASYPSNTTTTAGVQLKTTYATYISSSQVADTYNGKVKYVILHPSSNMPRTTIQDLTYMQDFKNLSSDEKISVAMSMQDRTVYTLIDNRDNKTYQIAKMKDGNIWMGENLDLGRTELTTDLTSENSNLGETVTKETFNDWRNNSTNSQNGIINLYEGIDEVSGIPYGASYNYHAATGGDFPGDYYSKQDENPDYDICPAGWRMPTDSNIRELYTYYNSVELFRNPITDGGAAFAITGYDGGTPGQYTGWYWTSTAVYSYSAHYYSVNTSYISFSSAGRQHISSVRCMAKKPSISFTVSYGEGIASIAVDGIEVPDETTFVGEKGDRHLISVITEPRYAFDKWSATYGSVEAPTSTYNASVNATDGTFNKYAHYVVGKTDSILSASSTYISTEMQNLNSSSCTTTPTDVYDNRDGRVYKIKRLQDGNCWMIDDLDLGRTALTTNLTSSNTNLSTTITASTFNGWDTTGSSSYNTYTSVGDWRKNNDGNYLNGFSYGINYNYYSATAGTISGNVNYRDAEYDICPAGWRLPTGGDYGEFKQLSENYDDFDILAKAPFDGGAAFHDVSYLTSTSEKAPNVYTGWFTYYNEINNISFYPTSIVERSGRTSIRCILKHPTSQLTISYGTGISSISIKGNTIADGSTITIEQGINYRIEATPSARYSLNNWSTTSGTIINPTLSRTFYNIGSSSSATLSISATYIETEMQNLSASSCTTAASKAYDNRDGRVYDIQRLPDGKCWMMENLDLGRTALTTDLTSNNTNLSNTITASTFNGWKKADSTKTSRSNYDGVFVSLGDIDSVNHTPLSTLYNFYAASASTISGYSNSDNASYDICPAGWRLPTGGNYGELMNLYNNYGTYNLFRAPLSENGAAFTMAGYFYDHATYQQEQGFYWSSTRYNNSDMNVLDLATTSPSPASNSAREKGYSIRCVMKTPEHTLTISYGSNVSSVTINGNTVTDGSSFTFEEGLPINIGMTANAKYAIDSWSATSGTIKAPTAQYTSYALGSTDATLTVSASEVNTVMQNLSASSCTTTASKVYDNRDNHVYIIKRLLDGKCWMMENLDLGRTELTTDLTKSNTNVNSTVTAATFNSWRVERGTRNYTIGEYIPLTASNTSNKSAIDSISNTEYGTLYNYYAASAGTVSGSSTSYAYYDICPAGWRLPTAGRYGEYQSMYSYYNNYGIIRAPLSENGLAFTLAGVVSGDPPSSQNENGHYWSSSYYNSNSSYTFSLSSYDVQSAVYGYEYRYSGYSIRCILKT